MCVLRKTVLYVHIYGGLLCFSYLILLGISVLNFNHPFAFTKPSAEETTWTQPISIPSLVKADSKTPPDAMQRLNDAAILHAMGSFAESYPNSNGSWTSPGTYHAHLVRPGKEYQIDVHVDQGTETVTQTKTGLWTLVRDLHGSYFIYADSVLASTWSWYTDLCTFVVVFAGISGIYLWTRRRRERRIGLFVIGIATVLSLSLMLFVTFHG
jgi:hypothetical protein